MSEKCCKSCLELGGSGADHTDPSREERQVWGAGSWGPEGLVLKESARAPNRAHCGVGWRRQL